MSMFINSLIALSALAFISFLIYWYLVVSTGIRSMIFSMKKRLP